MVWSEKQHPIPDVPAGPKARKGSKQQQLSHQKRVRKLFFGLCPRRRTQDLSNTTQVFRTFNRFSVGKYIVQIDLKCKIKTVIKNFSQMIMTPHPNPVPKKYQI